jgi:glucose-1-phosphate thymidylyltransferase
MKALVLAGGSGTRLRPITHTSPKQLMPVANKPVLFYGLEAIAAAGIRDAGIIVGHTGAEIHSAVGNGSQFGLRTTYMRQEAPLGLAHAVLVARDYLGDDDFVMYLGDNFVTGGISEAVAQFRADRPDAQLLLSQVDDPRAFGVAELDDAGRVVRLEEKPANPASDLALVGVYVFGSAVHRAVSTLQPSGRGELEITDAIQKLIDTGHRVESTMVSGSWKDVGSLADVLEANRLALEAVKPRIDGSLCDGTEVIGRVTVERGAQIGGSRIVGPAIIGSGSVIQDSYVGPFTSISSSCYIADSEIEYSIVLAGTSVRGVRRIAASVIGRDSEVCPARRTTRTHQLVIGDHSRIQISS